MYLFEEETLYVDNYYSSPNLAEDLQDTYTYFYGVVR